MKTKHKNDIFEITNIQDTYLLSNIPDYPKKLYARGKKDLLFDKELKFLCVIGSRKHSKYGVDVCEKLISALRGYPVVIISGLALGIDGVAHKTALENNLACIAVPGSGIDYEVLYPRTHTFLAEEIVEAGGLVVSEFEPTFRASPWSFPLRNRIMAGLSHAILVIEGEKDSGTLITARLGLEYNRDILSIPGSIFSPTSEGPLSLLKNGALPICTPEDLLSALGLIDTPLIRDASEVQTALQNCSREEAVILDSLNIPKTREELESEHSIPLGKLQIILSMLEVRNLISERFGKIYKTYKTRN